MVSRISTSMAYDGAINNLLQRQVNLSDQQIQLTSGKRVNKASDDPTAAARAERARALEARTTASERAVDASSNAMTLTSSALADAGDLLQSARELLVGAGDASYSDEQRQSIAAQIANIRNELLAVANRPDGQGGYIFSGQGSGGAPFVDQPGGVAFKGVGGQVNVASDEQLPLTLDGGNVFLAASSGNGVFQTSSVNSTGAWIDAGHVTDPSAITGSTYDVVFSTANGATTYSVMKDGQPTGTADQPYTSGQQISVDGMSFAISGSPADGDKFEMAPSQKNLSVFDTLDNIIKQLNTPSSGGAGVTQTVQNGLRDIDQVAAHLSSAESFAGSTLNRLDGVKGRLDSTQVSAETARSNAEDLDMVQALSSFNQQQTGYSAALQSYATIQKLSLFNYING